MKCFFSRKLSVTDISYELCFNMAPTHKSYSPRAYAKKPFSLHGLILHCAAHNMAMCPGHVAVHDPADFTDVKISWFKKNITLCIVMYKSLSPADRLIDVFCNRQPKKKKSLWTVKDFFGCCSTTVGYETILLQGSLTPVQK